jgi:hypothetical protein
MQSSLNLHAVGLHFVENITGIEEIPVVDPELSEEEEQPTLLTDRDILLIPRNWWSDKTGSLEPEDQGWWYTVTDPVKFRVCEVCTDRRGNDLDEETRASTSGNAEGALKCYKNLLKRARRE